MERESLILAQISNNPSEDPQIKPMPTDGQPSLRDLAGRFIWGRMLIFEGGGLLPYRMEVLPPDPVTVLSLNRMVPMQIRDA